MGERRAKRRTRPSDDSPQQQTQQQTADSPATTPKQSAAQNRRRARPSKGKDGDNNNNNNNNNNNINNNSNNNNNNNNTTNTNTTTNNNNKQSDKDKDKDKHRVKIENEPPEDEDVVMDEGNGTSEMLPTDQMLLKRAAKRKRDIVSSREAVRTTEPCVFFTQFVEELSQRPDCEDFLQPVLKLWSPSDVPNYTDKIKHPMDLGTVRERIDDLHYVLDTSPQAFAFDTMACLRDLRLIFSNCMDYNEPNSTLYNTSGSLLKLIDERVRQREAKLAKMAERAKREAERRRRKAAEEEAASAAANAARAAAALARAKKEAEEAERKRHADLQRMQKEFEERLKAEKEAAVAAALRDVLNRPPTAAKSSEVLPIAPATPVETAPSKLVNTSSVSSDEQETNTGEVAFVFVSTAGMEKKRGRKSAQVTELEMSHDNLMKRRRAMVDASADLEQRKQVEMSSDEKRQLCDDVSRVDFVKMKGVVDIIARGMNRPDILREVEVDVDIETVDNVVLREVQHFLGSPVALTAKEALREVEGELAAIEHKLVDIRYQKTAT